MRLLSIVIISKNEESHIAGCLESALTAAAEIGDTEIVVVDSASTDRTVEIARSFGVRVLSLRPEWEHSPAAGRYVGFHHTQGELVMFVDADTVIDRDWFYAAIPYFQQANVAGATGFLDDVDERGQRLPYVGTRSPQVCALPWLRGIGLYRREALHQVGAFNPYLITEEEAELCFRLRQKGWQLLQIPHDMGCHLRGAASPAFLLRGLRLGRFPGPGRTLRYAWRAGYGPRFCFERFKQTIAFVTACLMLLSGTVLFLTGHPGAAEVSVAMFVTAIAAIAIKKRSLLGPVNYFVHHSLLLCGLITGFFTTHVKDPWDYPLNAIEETSIPILVQEKARMRSLSATASPTQRTT